MPASLDPTDAHVRALLFSGAVLDLGGVGILAYNLDQGALESSAGSDPWFALALSLILGVPVSALLAALLLIPGVALFRSILGSARPRASRFRALPLIAGGLVLLACLYRADPFLTVILPGLGPSYFLGWQAALVLLVAFSAHAFVVGLLLDPS